MKLAVPTIDWQPNLGVRASSYLASKSVGPAALLKFLSIMSKHLYLGTICP